MEEIAEDIDKANALIHAGVLPIALGAIKSAEKSECAAAASLIATICRNNARGQVEIMKQGGLEIIVDQARKESDPASLAKFLSAIGSVVQNQIEALKVLDRTAGLPWLSRLLRDDATHSRVRSRAAFWLAC